ncbi:MAG: hypothetical protein ONB46_19075, partial [candidate division KSB1 bacterium]|nr:hypothetical protein [candidate division KSB1 bacterium]MDZ7405665.1 hypothetical protein [candidate division KSB1 bacterium]
ASGENTSTTLSRSRRRSKKGPKKIYARTQSPGACREKLVTLDKMSALHFHRDGYANVHDNSSRMTFIRLDILIVKIYQA